MSAIGVVEVIGADTSFATESVRPSVPGVGRARAGSTPVQTPSESGAALLGQLVQENIAATLTNAEVRADVTPGTTTLAALALAREIAGDHASAVRDAVQVLRMSSAAFASELQDPMAVRSALQILMRANMIEDALQFADGLPLTKRLSLEFGAALGNVGRLDDAWRFVNAASDVPQREAVVGYLLALEGEDQRAVPLLRAALREDPNDSDSALNLSIALSNIGAGRKALIAAEQARAAAPAREDIGLHLLELLLVEGSADRVDREVKGLFAQGVVPTIRLLVIHARAKLALSDFDGAIRILERAAAMARQEQDEAAIAEVQSNLIRLRAFHGRIVREKAIDQLLGLHAELPESAIIVVNLAQVASLRTHSAELKLARDSVLDTAAPSQLAFLDYQIATLDGDTAAAARHALEWVRLEPANPRALAAAMVALGIGEERWDEAAQLALSLRTNDSFSSSEVNNAAYVFAMAGMGEKAIQLLSPYADQSIVLKATLSLANLAIGHIDEGMKLYRRAADEAEKLRDDTRSLMTAYQALIVRQLGLLDTTDRTRVTAISLPPYPLPDDWRDRPEFLRLFAVAKRHNYGWPLSL